MQPRVRRPHRAAEPRPSGEDVSQGDGLQIATVDDVEQLGVAARDRRQVGVSVRPLWVGREVSVCRIARRAPHVADPQRPLKVLS